MHRIQAEQNISAINTRLALRLWRSAITLEAHLALISIRQGVFFSNTLSGRLWILFFGDRHGLLRVLLADQIHSSLI